MFKLSFKSENLVASNQKSRVAWGNLTPTPSRVRIWPFQLNRLLSTNLQRDILPLYALVIKLGKIDDII